MGASEECNWYSNMPPHKLHTAPGLCKLSMDTPLPSELEVTRHCPVSGCSWSSFKTFDKSMLDACVKELAIHVQCEHDLSSHSSAGGLNPSRRDKSHEEYIAATKPRTILKTVDDATNNLCEARFFPMPLDHKALGQN